jgi:FKBP12-rapamycin complex-associated protein
MDETVSEYFLILSPSLKDYSRLKGCQPDVEVWQRVLQVRTLVLNAVDDPMMWIKFANLCRKNDRMALAEKTINSLLMGSERVSRFTVKADRALIELQNMRFNDHHVKAPPHVVYAQLKFMWANGSRDHSLNFLSDFTESLVKDINGTADQTQPQRPTLTKAKYNELTQLVARCFYKQGEWQTEMKEDWNSVCTMFHFFFGKVLKLV